MNSLRLSGLNSSTFVVVVGACLSFAWAAAQSPPKASFLESDPLPPGAVRRFGTNRLRVEGIDHSLRFSPDGSLLFTGSGPILETKTWQEIWRAKPSTSSPDGKLLAQRTSECEIEIWDVRQKAKVRTCDFSRIDNMTIADFRFSDHGDALWIKNLHTGLWLYNWRQDEIVLRIPIAMADNQPIFQSADRKTIAFQDASRFAVHDAATGKLLREFTAMDGTWINLGPDGAYAVALDKKSGITFWDVATGQPRTILSRGALKAVENTSTDDELPHVTLQLDSKGTHFVVAGSQLAVVEIATGKIVATAPLGGRRPNELAISHDNARLAVGRHDGVIEIRDLLTLKPLVDDPHPKGPIRGLAFSDDGAWLATANEGHATSVLHVWNVREGRKSKSIDIDAAMAPSLRSQLTFLGDWIAVGGRQRWNVSTGARERLLDPDDVVVASSADSRRALTLPFIGLERVFVPTLYDVATRREIGKVPLPLAAAVAVVRTNFSLSADGQWVAACTPIVDDDTEGLVSSTIGVWKMAADRAEPVFSTTLAPQPAARIRLSPDGRFLSLHGDLAANAQQMWHVPSGYPLWKNAPKTPAAPKNVVAWFAFSPNDWFAAARTENGLVVYELLSGEVLRRFTGASGTISALAFSPDGRLLASGSSDGSVLLWEISRFAAARPGEWRPPRFASLWDGLRGEAPLAYQAMADLHAGGDEAAALLATKIHDHERAHEAALMRQTLADLGSDQFAVREKASARALEFGFRLKPHLAEALAKPAGLEQKRRLAALFERLKDTGIDADELRLARAIYVLEQIGTSPARAGLESLAHGHPTDLATQTALAALKRLSTSPR